MAKASGVVAGLWVATAAFERVDPRVTVKWNVGEGQRVSQGTVLGVVSGPARAVLVGERVSLNFMQRASGVATATARMVTALEGTGASLLDTRKTVPGLRLLDKWAVKAGGGTMHRIGLFDMVMIKDNHIAAAGGIRQAVERVEVRMSGLRIGLGNIRHVVRVWSGVFWGRAPRTSQRLWVQALAMRLRWR